MFYLLFLGATRIHDYSAKGRVHIASKDDLRGVSYRSQTTHTIHIDWEWMTSRSLKQNEMTIG